MVVKTYTTNNLSECTYQQLLLSVSRPRNTVVVQTPVFWKFFMDSNKFQLRQLQGPWNIIDEQILRLKKKYSNCITRTSKKQTNNFKKQTKTNKNPNYITICEELYPIVFCWSRTSKTQNWRLGLDSLASAALTRRALPFKSYTKGETRFVNIVGNKMVNEVTSHCDTA